MSDSQVAAKPAQRSLIIDGPPFVAVAVVFVLLVTFWVGRGQPVAGLAVLATGMIVTVALEFRAWRMSTRAERRAAEDSLASLPGRLLQARARQIERDRWQ